MTILHLAAGGLIILLIITAATLILTLYLLSSVATSAQIALVTVGFWTYLGVLVLTLP